MKFLNHVVIVLLVSLSIACQNSAKKEVDSSSIDNITTSENEQKENDFSLLTGQTFYALLLTPNSSISSYIEPSCLSDAPSLRFAKDEIGFACGQDAISYKVKSLTKKDENYSFNLGNDLVLDLEYVESEPFDFINIKLNDIDKLFMGYYPDSIMSANSDRIQMVLWTADTREVLKREGRYTTLECPDDTFD